jgi:hypothetical protein
MAGLSGSESIASYPCPHCQQGTLWRPILVMGEQGPPKYWVCCRGYCGRTSTVDEIRNGICHPLGICLDRSAA